MCKASPVCYQLRRQVTWLAPNRDSKSDGICGDAAHKKRKSDHNARTSGPAKGYALAIDLDEDLFIPGYTMEDLVRDLKKDPRVKNIIYEKRIAYRSTGFKWEKYSGPNPHDKHAHVSFYDWAWNDTRPFPIGPQPVWFEEDEVAITNQLNDIIDRLRRIEGEQAWQRKKLENMGGDNFEIKNRLGIPDGPADKHPRTEFNSLVADIKS